MCYTESALTFFFFCGTIQSILLLTNFLFFLLTFDAADAPKNIVAQASPPTAKEGAPVTFTCSASGNPEPKYTWFKNKKQVSPEAEWKIPSVDADEDGSYVCEAKNDRGNASATADVHVICESSSAFTHFICSFFF